MEIKVKNETLNILAIQKNKSKVYIKLQVTDFIHYDTFKISNTDSIIIIFLSTYNLFSNGPFHEIIKLKRNYKNIIISNNFEIHYIQLDRFKETIKFRNKKLVKWLDFICCDNYEYFNIFNNKYIDKAKHELKILNLDDYSRKLASYAQNKISELHINKSFNFNQGVTYQSNIIAKNMLKENFDLNIIRKITGLSKNEILDL